MERMDGCREGWRCRERGIDGWIDGCRGVWMKGWMNE